MLTRIFLTIAVATFAANCGKGKNKSANHDGERTYDDERTPGKNVLMEKLDLSNITSIGLRKGSSGLNLTDDNDSQLVSLDETGTARPLSLVESGTETKFAGIVPVGGDFVYFILDYHSINIETSNGESCPTVVLRKSDGKLFCIPDVMLSTVYTGRSFENDFVTDRSGRLHYFDGEPYKEGTFTGYPYIYSVDFRSGDNPKVAIRYNKIGYAEQRATNQTGDLLFRFYEEIGDRQMRIARADGGFQPAGWRPYVDCLTSGEGRDREAFFFTEGTAMGKLARNSSGIYEETYIYPTNYTGAQDNATLKGFSCRSVTSDQENIYWLGEVGTYDSDTKQYNYDTHLVTHKHETNALSRIPIPGIKSLQQITPRKDSLVILGLSAENKVTIKSVDKATGAVSTLFELDAVLTENDAHNWNGSMAVQETSLTLTYYVHSKNGYESVIVGSGADKATEQDLQNLIIMK